MLSYKQFFTKFIDQHPQRKKDLQSYYCLDTKKQLEEIAKQQYKKYLKEVL